MASRLQVANHLAGHLADGRADAIRAAAAWLVSTGRRRQAGYLAGDVAALLAAKGHVYVKITTARPLTPGVKAEIEHYVRRLTGASTLELDVRTEAGLIGGVIIETPNAIMDASVRSKLARYVEGVTK